MTKILILGNSAAAVQLGADLVSAAHRREMDREHGVDQVIESYRFACQSDRVLARVENDDEGFALFPCADDLRERGINVELLADLLVAGHVKVDDLGGLFRHNSVRDINGALELVLENAQDEAAEPDPAERSFNRVDQGFRGDHGFLADELNATPFDFRREDFGPRSGVELLVEA
jgi:hypothetical protein